MKVTDLATTPQSVVGVFDSEAAAQQAVRRLQAHGVADEAIGVARRSEAPPPSDTPAMSRVFWSGFWWSVVGLAAGVAMGFALGSLGVGVPGTPESVWLQVASWGMFVHVLGAIVGCYLALDTGDRFSAGAAHHDRPVTMVRVSVGDEEELTRLEGLLRAEGAAGIERSAGSST